MVETQPRRSADPSDNLGVYARLEDVADRHRLYHHSDAYAGRDVWAEFCAAHEFDRGTSDEYREDVARVGDRWKGFMADRDRHHALATPSDVEVWVGELLEKYSMRHSYDNWVRINRFYRWLQWSADHPHTYNPALMAATMDGHVADLWAWQDERNRKRRAERRDGR